MSLKPEGAASFAAVVPSEIGHARVDARCSLPSDVGSQESIHGAATAATLVASLCMPPPPSSIPGDLEPTLPGSPIAMLPSSLGQRAAVLPSMANNPEAHLDGSISLLSGIGIAEPESLAENEIKEDLSSPPPVKGRQAWKKPMPLAMCSSS